MLPKNNPLYTFAQAKAVMADFIHSYKTSAGIVRLEIRIKPVDQMQWLNANADQTKVFGANHDDRASIAGLGAAVIVKGQGKANFSKVLPQLRAFLTPQYPFMQWYGGFGFDTSSRSRLWNNFGSWHFVLPRFELARDQDKMIFSCNLKGKINRTQVLDQLSKLTLAAVPLNHGKVKSRRDLPNQKQFEKNVNRLLKSIDQHGLQKAVYARRTDLTFDQPVNPWAILKSLKKVTPNSYHFAFQFGRSVFLGASPERLYKRYGRQITSEALAGTKAVSVDPQELLHSSKDLFEHQFVVEAIGKSFDVLCEQHEVSPKPQVRTLSNGHHLLTVFQGQLKSGVKDEDILQSLHPTPALAGTPREKALKIIKQLEPQGRGWYAGPVGYVGLDWVEFVMGIRSALVQGPHLHVFAGAGIVQGSKPRDEWDEIENKISNFIKIIK